jgi:hypothetical protein
MRANALVLALLAAASAAPALAQTRIPSVTRSERTIIETNRALQQQSRSLGASQQTQFEINQLRGEIGRGAITTPPPVIAPRICAPGAC